MTRNDLIASVALDFIKAHLEQETEGSLRFCMLGIEASLVCSIAHATLTDTKTSNCVSVKVSPIFDPDNLLPDNARSNQSITVNWPTTGNADYRRCLICLWRR